MADSGRSASLCRFAGRFGITAAGALRFELSLALHIGNEDVVPAALLQLRRCRRAALLLAIGARLGRIVGAVGVRGGAEESRARDDGAQQAR